MAFSTVAQQDKLKARTAPYWQKLATGQHLGFRKTRTACTWLARAYEPATQKQMKRSLGDFGGLQPHERFNAASKAAHEWFEHMGAGGRAEVITVRAACERYAEWVGRTGGKKGAALTLERRTEKAKEARRRFAQYVNTDPIASIPLPKLQARHVEAWRQRLTDTPAMVERRGKGCGRGRGKGGRTRPRAATTTDRDLIALRAALNRALAEGYTTSAMAWAEALKPSNAHARRALYLDRAQRRALIEAIPDAEMRAFVAALAVLPLRPGALAALTAGDFDARQRTLRIGTDKEAAGRVIPLPSTVVATIEQAARAKLPAAPLFARWDGKAWRTDEWVKAIKAAALAAKLPANTVGYTLRHSAITDLVSAGLDLFTVAKLAGTSVAMIEKHYGHLQQDRARDALAGLAL